MDIAKKLRDGCAFGRVIKYCRRSMAIHVVNLGGLDSSRLQRTPHRELRTNPRGIRLRQMKGIRCRSVTNNLGDRSCAPGPSRLFGFQDKERGALTQNHPGSFFVKRPNLLRSRRLKRIETYEYQLTNRVVSAARNASAQAGSDQLEPM